MFLLPIEYQCFKLYPFKIAMSPVGTTVAGYHVLASQEHITAHCLLPFM